MPASYLSKITDDMIAARIAQIEHVEVQTSGGAGVAHLADACDTAVREIAETLTVAAVRDMLTRHSIGGDDARGEIDSAISMACEPEDFPVDECGTIVCVRYEGE